MSSGRITGNQPDPSAAPAGMATVFVVEADEAVRESISMLLASVGWAVEPFSSAEAFLHHSDRDTRGCLLVDVNLPGMGGLELLAHLADQGRALPAVVVSGRAREGDAQRARALGAIGYIFKPFGDQVLVERVREALSTIESPDCPRE